MFWTKSAWRSPFFFSPDLSLLARRCRLILHYWIAARLLLGWSDKNSWSVRALCWGAKTRSATKCIPTFPACWSISEGTFFLLLPERTFSSTQKLWFWYTSSHLCLRGLPTNDHRRFNWETKCHDENRSSGCMKSMDVVQIRIKRIGLCGDLSNSKGESRPDRERSIRRVGDHKSDVRPSTTEDD